jgi:ACS family glucarate transporter-like MFS transporter
MIKTQKSWSLMLMLCATATASYICRVNVSTAGVLMMKEFSLSQTDMGKIFSAFLLGYALFQVPAGMLADKWGAKRILSLAAWFWISLTIIQTFIGVGPFQSSSAAAITAFMICRFFLGISESPTFPGSAQGVSKWISPRFQGRANGIVIAAVGLGSAIAPLIVGYTMVLWGWRIALVISALPAVCIVLFWKFIKPPITKVVQVQIMNEVQPATETSRNYLHSFSFYLLTFSYTLQGYVGYIFVSWFYIYLVQVRHFSLLTGAWMSSLPWILSIISIPLGGLISDRLAAGPLGEIRGRRMVPIIGMGLSGILISIGAHTSSATLAAISLAFATALILCVEGPFWAMMMRIAGKNSGTAGGIMNMGSNLGGFVSPFLTPFLAKFIGWENALHLAAILAIIAGLSWLGIKPLSALRKEEIH